MSTGINNNNYIKKSVFTQMMIIYMSSSERSLFHKHLKVPSSYLIKKKGTLLSSIRLSSRSLLRQQVKLVPRHGETCGSRVKSKWRFGSFWAASCSVFHVAPSEPNKSARFLLLVKNVITGRLDCSLQEIRLLFKCNSYS